MGWNDRLPEDPYIPPESFYRDRDDYEAWLDYVEMRLNEEERAGLSSQNLDPRTLSKTPLQEPPARQSILSRIWAQIFGQNNRQNASQDKTAREKVRKENVDAPF